MAPEVRQIIEDLHDNPVPFRLHVAAAEARVANFDAAQERLLVLAVKRCANEIRLLLDELEEIYLAMWMVPYRPDRASVRDLAYWAIGLASPMGPVPRAVDRIAQGHLSIFDGPRRNQRQRQELLRELHGALVPLRRLPDGEGCELDFLDPAEPAVELEAEPTAGPKAKQWKKHKKKSGSKRA